MLSLGGKCDDPPPHGLDRSQDRGEGPNTLLIFLRIKKEGEKANK